MTDAALDAWPERRASARSAPRRQAGTGRLTGKLVLVLCLLGGTIAIGAKALPSLPTVPVSTPVAAPPAWRDIQKPVQVFSLQGPEVASLPLVYAARRRSVGTGREDVLTFGALGGEGPALRLRIFRTDVVPKPPLYAALARQAAEAGLSVGRSGLPDLLDSRFGKFEIADITLVGAQPDSGDKGAACSGFRLILDTPGLSITGLACGRGAPFPRATLGCLIDRLDLSSGGEDHALIDFFAASELRRNPACGGMRLGPDQVHAAWLDDKPATPRKHLRHH